MLAECTTSKLNQLPPNNICQKKQETHSPYFLQYKLFEDRLKNQHKLHPSKWKSNRMKYSNVNLKNRKDIKEDYVTLVKQMMLKNENINLFG